MPRSTSSLSDADDDATLQEAPAGRDPPRDIPHIDVIDTGEMTYASILPTETGSVARRRARVVWCSIVLHVGCAALMTGLWLWLYLAKRDAPCARPLSLWALVNALSPVCLLLLAFVHSALKTHTTGSYSPWLMMVSALSCLVTVFYLVWFFIGNVWAYGMRKGECDATLYLVCFWVITGVYIAVGLSCTFPCLQLAYAFWARDPQRKPPSVISLPPPRL